MSQRSIDRIALLCARASTRRTLLGTLLGAGLLGGAVVEGKQQRKKRRRRRRRHGTGGLRDCPTFGPGQNLSRCNFAGRDLRGADLRAANLSGAMFGNANLCSANLSAATLDNANFSYAVLTRADLRAASLGGAIFEGATFCQTQRPGNQIDNSGCPATASAICCNDGECGAGEICGRDGCGGSELEGSCLAMNALCSAYWGPPCCDYGNKDNVTCGLTDSIIITTCQVRCKTDEECQRKTGTTDAICFNNAISDIACVTFDQDTHCCGRKFCQKDSDCQNGRCCPVSQRSSICCMAGETCLPAPLGCG